MKDLVLGRIEIVVVIARLIVENGRFAAGSRAVSMICDGPTADAKAQLDSA